MSGPNTSLLSALGMQSAMAAPFVPGDYHRHREQGDSAGKSLLSAGGNFASNTLLSIPVAFEISAVGMIAPAVINGAYGRTNKMNKAARPFSQRFQHTEMSSRLQSYTLSRMNGMTGVGNEAADAYGSYGR